MDQAVALGIGWPDIAHRLGVTRQAARQPGTGAVREGSAQLACPADSLPHFVVERQLTAAAVLQTGLP